MKVKIDFKLIAICFAVALFPREAWMSGNAGFLLIDSDYTFEYVENFRKKVHTDNYQAYWAAKRAQFDDMIRRQSPDLIALEAKLKSEKFPLIPLILSHGDPAHPHAVTEEVQNKGEDGEATLRFQMSEALSGEGKTRFHKICISALSTLLAASKAGGGASGNTGDFVNGLTVSTDLPKYSLALSVVGKMRKETAAAFRPRLESYLKKLAPPVLEGFEKRMSTGKTWMNPKKLVSFASKAASTGISKEAVFNPTGPLHDSFGRRTQARSGLMVATMLFMTRDPGEVEDAAFAGNTGEFEDWFARVVDEHLK